MQPDRTRYLAPSAPWSDACAAPRFASPRFASSGFAVRWFALLCFASLWFAAAGSGVWAAGADANDERLTLPEVRLAASARFDKLDHDGDGTLDPAEVQGRIGKTQFKAADTDHDGTLNKDEYLALVEKLFNRADVHHDGALDVAELRSKSARALQPLIS
jgi:hypothetical protein